MAYGHREKDNCDDVEWLIGLDNTSKEEVSRTVRGLNPTGKTPLARSALMALDRLKAQQQPATLILITDGIESCDGDLCQTIAEAKLSGIDFKLHIVGFGIREETTGLQCAADAGGGQYFDASDAEKLSAALQKATQTTINVTVNVIDKALRKSMAGSRTYTSPSSTPRTYHLTPGLYEVKVRALGSHSGHEDTFDIEIKPEATVEKTITY